MNKCALEQCLARSKSYVHKGLLNKIGKCMEKSFAFPQWNLVLFLRLREGCKLIKYIHTLISLWYGARLLHTWLTAGPWHMCMGRRRDGLVWMKRERNCSAGHWRIKISSERWERDPLWDTGIPGLSPSGEELSHITNWLLPVLADTRWPWSRDRD